MNIKILGTGCKKCNVTEQVVKDFVAKHNIEATIEKVTDLKEIAQYGVMLTPSVVVDGKAKIVGKIPTEKELLKALGI